MLSEDHSFFSHFARKLCLAKAFCEEYGEWKLDYLFYS